MLAPLEIGFALNVAMTLTGKIACAQSINSVQAIDWCHRDRARVVRPAIHGTLVGFRGT